jgi:hypothetical protein
MNRSDTDSRNKILTGSFIAVIEIDDMPAPYDCQSKYVPRLRSLGLMLNLMETFQISYTELHLRGFELFDRGARFEIAD